MARSVKRVVLVLLAAAVLAFAAWMQSFRQFF